MTRPLCNCQKQNAGHEHALRCAKSPTMTFTRRSAPSQVYTSVEDSILSLTGNSHYSVPYIYGIYLFLRVNPNSNIKHLPIRA